MLADKMEVMIVDDEPRQRRGLAAMVRTLRPDYRVCEAKNGKEALEAAQNRQPDIVFTDIQMPLVNGLDLLEALNNNGCKKPKVVFVSVFNEFAYAQRAIQLGAKDYLVKPVSTESLDNILKVLERQLQSESIVSTRTKILADELAQTKPVYMEHLLYKWMTEELLGSELRELQSSYTFQGPGTVLILETDPDDRPEAGLEWRSILKRAVLKALGALAETFILSPEHEKCRMYVIVQWKPGADGREGLERLRTTLAQLGIVHGKAITAGIGSETAAIETGIRACCDSAKAALQYLYYFAGSTWLTADAMHSLMDKAAVGTVTIKDTGRLEEAVTMGDLELALQASETILDKMSAARPAPFRMKCSAIQLLLSCIKRAAPVLDDAAYAEFAERIDQELLATSTLSDTKAVSARLLTGIVNQMKKDKGSRSELIMQKCREYLEENLHEDLGLETVAQRFFYNASYFSILFKNHFGLSFTDYLVKSRMQKARGLLLQSDKKVADIAREVGYKDIKYFNKVFKKLFLYSPDEFRRMFATT